MARKPRDIARFRRALKLLGERIAERRGARKWTQEHLAEVSGLTLNTIGQIERANVSCSLETLIQIAAALEIETSALIEGLDALVPKYSAELA